MRKVVITESVSSDNLDVCKKVQPIISVLFFLPTMLPVYAQLDCEKVYSTATANYMIKLLIVSETRNNMTKP